jgi:putative CocE/NonD family hydrolase
VRVALTSRFFRRVFRLPPPRTYEVDVERDVAIPMDDGVELRADIYAPQLTEMLPTVLVRSPYGRAGVFGTLFGRLFAERGMRVVVQSCRGTFGSGGTFRVLLDDRDDGLATVRWIEQQPWFDGRLGMAGPSYLGYVQWAIADSVPNLRALCPQVTTSTIATHWYLGGTLALDDAIHWSMMVATQESHRFPWVEAVARTVPRKVNRAMHHVPLADLDERVLGHRDERWRSIVEHADDPGWWAPTDHTDRVSAVTAPVNMVTGWYDLFLPLQLDDYARLVAAGRQPQLTIGPWTHTDRENFACSLRESLAWFGAHFSSPAPAVGDAVRADPVRVQVMGSGEWRDFPSWPPPGYTAAPWHLRPGGRLGEPPDEESEPTRYTYDPRDPTPSTGGAVLGMGEGGAKDQRSTELRPDVRSFTSAVLTDDVEVIGEVFADIHVAADVEHFDVFVRVCDVDEQHQSTNVCDGLTRVRPAGDASLASDGVRVVRVQLWPTAYRFRTGHRVRVQVASGAHPRFVRNLGTGAPIATGTEMRVAHLAIHHSAAHPSVVFLPVRG